MDTPFICKFNFCLEKLSYPDYHGRLDANPQINHYFFQNFRNSHFFLLTIPRKLPGLNLRFQRAHWRCG